MPTIAVTVWRPSRPLAPLSWAGGAGGGSRPRVQQGRAPGSSCPLRPGAARPGRDGRWALRGAAWGQVPLGALPSGRRC